MKIAQCVLSILVIGSVFGCGNQNKNNGVFTVGDTILPFVSSTTPTNNAVNMAVDAKISVTFSEAVDGTTINNVTLTVNDVSGSVTFDNDKTATFTPSANLDYNRVYTAMITTGVKDLAENSMATNYTWNFTTCKSSLNTPPIISSTMPPNNATNEAVNQAISVKFNEVIDDATINATTFTVSGVTGTVTYNADTGTATLTPSANLDYNKLYTATITTGVKDISGDSVASDYHWSFTTRRLKLPDTGQTISYTSNFGEDPDYIINPPSYTDNGNGIINDNVTGFVWQKEDDNAIRGWDTASAYCDNLTLGGYTDWRMPTINELMSIIDYSGTGGAAINSTYFPHTIHWSMSQYWSVTASPNNAGNAWDVVFDNGSIQGAAPNGSVYGASKTSTYYIRCIRGGQYPTLRYTDNGNGTITENNTLLTWQKDDDDTTRTWEQALGYCEGLTLAGYTDWRLPNIKELHYLVDSATYNPAIDTTAFPSSKAAPYWSSTTIASASSFAWFVDFYYGYAGAPYSDKTGSYYVRCLRSGQ